MMARVDTLGKASMDRHAVHEAVEATCSTFTDAAGSTYLQIDTYGSAGRQLPGKKSQSLQFGPEGLAALKRILSEL